MEQPKFKISGKERRLVKKQVRFLKGYLKDFWYVHQLEKDLSIGIPKTNGYPMSDPDAQIKYNEASEELLELEKLLQEHE